MHDVHELTRAVAYVSINQSINQSDIFKVA